MDTTPYHLDFGDGLVFELLRQTTGADYLKVREGAFTTDSLGQIKADGQRYEFLNLITRLRKNGEPAGLPTLDLDPHARGSPNPISENPQMPAIVHIENLVKNYYLGAVTVYVLKDLNLTLYRGDINSLCADQCALSDQQ